MIDKHDQETQTAAAKLETVWVLVTITTAGLRINGHKVPAAWCLPRQYSTVFVKKMLDQVIVMATYTWVQQ